MKPLTPSIRQVSKRDNISMNQQVVSVAIKNIGAAPMFVNWNEEANEKNVLFPGEEQAWGFEGFSLGGNTLFYDFQKNAGKPLGLIKMQSTSITNC